MNITLQPRVETRIQIIRGAKVILDADLAELYGVSTKALNQAVKRNIARFPPDFRFQLDADEKAEVVTNCDHLEKLKFSKVLPHAFTEHGAIQAANVLASPLAIEMASMWCAPSCACAPWPLRTMTWPGALRRWNTKPRLSRCTMTTCSMTPRPSCGRYSTRCAR